MRRLQHMTKAIGGCVVLALVSACGDSSGVTTLSPNPTTAEAEAARLTDLENALLALINQERVAGGLPVLARDLGLDEIMLWYGTDMVLDYHIGHVDANGRRSEERVRYYSGRDDVRCSEITSWQGNGTAEDHYDGYYNSPDHHSGYMEEGAYNLGPTTHVGVVMLEGTGPVGSPYKGRPGTYSALVFCDDAVTVVIDPFAE